MMWLYVMCAFWAGGIVGFTAAALMASASRDHDQVIVLPKGASR